MIPVAIFSCFFFCPFGVATVEKHFILMLFLYLDLQIHMRNRRGPNGMIIVSTITYAIIAYPH
jgi:hypothetical protein